MRVLRGLVWLRQQGHDPADPSRLVRDYAPAPYRVVGDHISGLAREDVEAVLDGDLDSFFHARLARAEN